MTAKLPGSSLLHEIRTVLLCAVAFAPASCGIVVPVPASVHLYPLRGPISDQKPVPVIPATAWGTVFSTSLSIDLPDGETFEGSVIRVSPSDSADDDLASVWDSVYGSGHYLARVLGSGSHGRATLRGNRGATLVLEVNTETKESPLEGVAKDSKGNVFKVTR